jgi:hypothetical protein
MVEAASHVTQAWEGFYVIVGTSAGALIGLQFVVLTLITEAGVVRGSGETLAAFGSPTVVHFCMALLVSAIFAAPWEGLRSPGVAVGVVGACGFIYSAVVLRRVMRQREYKPVLEDWIWHAAIPMATYAALLFAGIQLGRASADALYIVGGSTLLLMFIGIHNAWDTVMFVTVDRARRAGVGAGAAGSTGSVARGTSEGAAAEGLGI